MSTTLWKSDRIFIGDEGQARWDRLESGLKMDDEYLDAVNRRFARKIFEERRKQPLQLGPDPDLLESARVQIEAVGIIAKALAEILHPTLEPTDHQRIATAIIARLAQANLLLERYVDG